MTVTVAEGSGTALTGTVTAATAAVGRHNNGTAVTATADSEIRRIAPCAPPPPRAATAAAPEALKGIGVLIDDAAAAALMSTGVGSGIDTRGACVG